nr:hypothetical protein CFP56_07095 [Quercus suber]
MTINDGLGVEGEANKIMKSDTRSNLRASLLSNGQGQVVQTPVYRDEQPLDEPESDSDDVEISFNPHSFSIQLRSPSLLTPSLTAVVVFYGVNFCGEIGIFKGFCGSSCEIGVDSTHTATFIKQPPSSRSTPSPTVSLTSPAGSMAHVVPKGTSLWRLSLCFPQPNPKLGPGLA